jgi:hypothetical protein
MRPRLPAPHAAALRAKVATVPWLAVSLVLSLVLTVVLNVAVHVFPGIGDRIGRGLQTLVAPRRGEPSAEPGVRWYFPWRAMLVASLGLTVAINLVRWLA